MTDASYDRWGRARLARRDILGLALSGIGLAGLAGCSGPSISGGDVPSAKASARDYSGVKPAAKIDFWTVHPGKSQAIEAKLVKGFNASQSDTEVKLVTAGASYGDIAQKFQTAQVSKTLPGLLVLSGTTWFTYYLNRTIVPVDALVKAVELDVDDYQKPLWDDYVYQDATWMVPYARSTPLFFYNKGHFKRAGLPDRAPETWMEFEEWAVKLMNADLGIKHIFECGGPTDDPTWTFAGNVWAWGGNYSKEFEFTNSSAPTKEAFEWGRKSIFTDKWAGVASNGPGENLGAGASAATIGSTGGLRGILEAAKGKFEVGTGFLPGGPKVTDPVCSTGGSGLAIPSEITPEEQLAAMNFIKFATTPENTVEFSRATGYMPVRASADTSQLIAETPQIETAIKQVPHTRGQDYAREFVPGGIDVLNEMLGQLFLKQDADVDKVLAAADEKLKTIYERDVKPNL